MQPDLPNTHHVIGKRCAARGASHETHALRMQAGHEIIMMCECDPGAQQVLRAHFPGVLLLPDVASVGQLPQETELVAAGFPCIDVSRAGLRKGIHQGAVRSPVATSSPVATCPPPRPCTEHLHAGLFKLV